MATNYNYPTKDQIPYPAVSGMSNREYERYRILQENQRRRAGVWGGDRLTSQDTFLSRPLDTLLNEFGLADSNRWYSGGLIDFADQINPLSIGYRIGDELSQGNFRNAGAEAVNVFASKIPVFKNPAGRSVKKKIVTTVSKGAAALGLPFVASAAKTTDQNGVPYTKTPLLPQTRDMTMTADQMERRAAAERNRTDAQGRSGMGATSVLPGPVIENRPPGGYPVRPEFDTFEPPVPVAPGAPIARVPMPALSPLSPEELGQYGQDLTAIDKLYKQTLADIAQEEEQGQLGYARVGQAAQRRAAGSAQDLANQMAGSSIGGSPAAAFGAEQMVQAPLIQQRQANRLNLDQLLAQLQKQKTQAGTAMDMSKLGLNRWMTQQQAANTRSQIESGYRNSLGGM
jgi:hypothetical protein